MSIQLKAPFPYFGGKGMIADRVWQYLGDCKMYLEPFFGSGAVLLRRPKTSHANPIEIVNDADGFVANAWRCIQFKPEETARWCDWPVNHADLTARRIALIEAEGMLLELLLSDAEACDVKLGGYWIWAASCWIWGGLTSKREIPVLTHNPGVQQTTIRRTTLIPHLTHDRGIVTQRPGLTSSNGCTGHVDIYGWFRALSKRLRHVKVVCGDWSRICGGNWRDKHSSVGMFFDPPYATGYRDKNLYHKDSMTVGKDVETWVLENGKKENHRIVVCGYEDEYHRLVDAGWRVEAWKANGGYSNRGKNKSDNRYRERVFISPHCLRP